MIWKKASLNTLTRAFHPEINWLGYCYRVPPSSPPWWSWAVAVYRDICRLDFALHIHSTQWKPSSWQSREICRAWQLINSLAAERAKSWLTVCLNGRWLSANKHVHVPPFSTCPQRRHFNGPTWSWEITLEASKWPAISFGQKSQFSMYTNVAWISCWFINIEGQSSARRFGSVSRGREEDCLGSPGWFS